MAEPSYRDFYRIVKGNPASLLDFVSNAARGRPKPSDPEDARVWDGISVYSTAAQARRQRRRSPMLGAFIVVLRIPLDGSIRIERTRGEGHHTLWGAASALFATIVGIETV